MSFIEDGGRYNCTITAHGVEQAEGSNALYLWLTFDVDMGDVPPENGSHRIYLLNKQGEASDKHRRATLSQLKHIGFDGDVGLLDGADLVGNEFEATAKENERGYIDWDFRPKRAAIAMSEDAAARLQAIYG